MKAKTFQRKGKFFPICLFCMCFKTSDLCSLMTDESSSRTRDHRLTYVSCSEEGRERGRGWGRREQHAGFTGTTAHSERERDDRRRETHARLTSTISVLEYLVRVCSTGWMTEICTTVFSFRSQTGATRSLHAGNSRKRKKEKHLTRSDLLGQTSVQSWNKLCLFAEGNLLVLSWLYRGSLLEVPYRNRKSRAAKLNWEFISTDHICSTCKSRVLGYPSSSVWICRHTAPGLRGLWIAINPWTFIHTPASWSEFGPQLGN